MPYTPYHFGPSGLVALAMRRWIDAPVFILANVAADFSVVGDWIFQPGWPVHQFGHVHTLLGGAVFGAVYGAAMFGIAPLQTLCKTSMNWLGLPYRPTLKRAVLAGIFGVWAHVLVDAFVHSDVQIFWPFLDSNPIWTYLVGHRHKNILDLRDWIVAWCIGCWAILVVYYGWLVDTFKPRKDRIATIRRKRQNPPESASDGNTDPIPS